MITTRPQVVNRLMGRHFWQVFPLGYFVSGVNIIIIEKQLAHQSSLHLMDESMDCGRSQLGSHHHDQFWDAFSNSSLHLDVDGECVDCASLRRECTFLKRQESRRHGLRPGPGLRRIPF